MTDAETIAALKAELEQMRKRCNYEFEQNCKLQQELDGLARMRGVLMTLSDLARQVYEANKK